MLALLVGGTVVAASIPAWLDAAITTWNEENADLQIRFVDIKDSFVWYMIPKTEQTGHERIRQGTYSIAEKNGYEATDSEEIVTTARPPAPTGPHKERKCWSRSFTQDLDVGRQRLLTCLVCSGDTEWLVGFRTAE